MIRFIAAIASAVVGIVSAEDKMTSLNANIFDEQIVDNSTMKVKGDKPWFIKFFAPWCGHCKHLAPTWLELANNYGDEINVAEVDCTDSNANILCEQFSIRGYPSLILLKDDKYYQFK